MKVLIISQYWKPENGVPQRRWAWLSELLVREGNQVTAIVPPPHYNRNLSIGEWCNAQKYRSVAESVDADSEVRVIRSGFIPSGASLTRKALNQAAVAISSLWVLMKRPGVLHSYYPDLVIGTVPALPTAVVTWLVARRYRVPYIIDLRDAWPDLLEESANWNSGVGNRSWRERLTPKVFVRLGGRCIKGIIEAIIRDASSMIVTSSKFRAELQSMRSNDHSANGGVFLVRNVFEPETEIDHQSYRTKESRELNVLYAGTIGRAQNLSNAIKAVKEAQDRGFKINLRLVGAGAAKRGLVELSEELGVNTQFKARTSARDLSEDYRWADTALVHLTDWPALERAVPSKTYELMENNILITGVVSGETAELIRSNLAGVVVPPESPNLLADAWIRLIDANKDDTSMLGRRWVRNEREKIAPSELFSAIASALQSGNGNAR